MEEDATAALLRGASASLDRARDEALRTMDLSPKDFRAMRAMAGVKLSQREIGDAAGLDRTTMVALVDRLAERELAQRRRCRIDRRRYIVTLTRRGKSALGKAEKAIAAAEEEYFRPLDDISQSALRLALCTLTSAAEAGPQAPQSPLR
ncbi:MarR family winged helix-turn-helix transcriptional regulator [Salininema proteolyticum]|uniref:MarR family winged helix-turn-helix transcriptional regulator n=1 Tax=Salininema proteolyticum TaxID=1607685 RepID=A0ABV8U1Z1_9ACTN